MTGCGVVGRDVVGDEQARAALVGAWWRGDGLAEVHTDAVGNLWARVPEAEWIDPADLPAGLTALAATVSTLDSGQW